MKKSRFTETQIVKAIQEHEAGRKGGAYLPGIKYYDSIAL